jgi:o-succinylbenzoate synthase
LASVPSLSINFVKLPLRNPFRTSLGLEKERQSLILEYSFEGIRAFSECAAFDTPYYSYEDSSTALHVIQEYLSKELSAGPPTPEEFLQKTRWIRGHPMAKGAVEMLLWDYASKVKNRPIHQELGNSRGYAEVGISLGLEDTPELLLKKVDAAVARGYKRVKIKIKKGTNPVRSVRDLYPEISLSVDANGGYTLKDLDALKKLDRYNLSYIEQPLEYDDLLDHATLAKQLSTPICLDESITTPRSTEQAFEIGAAKIVNIKPGRLSGLYNSIEVARIAREQGGAAWVGGMLETGVGRAFNIALASLQHVTLPGDTSPNDEYFDQDIVRNPFKMEGGIIQPNSGPGIGVELDEDILSRSAEHRLTIF